MLNLNVSMFANRNTHSSDHLSASYASLGDSASAARTDRLRDQAGRNHESVRKI
jgi:hypothetical protein